MAIAITPSQTAAPEWSFVSVVVTVPAGLTVCPGSAIVTTGAGPTAVGELSSSGAPAFSGGPVHGFTAPSA